MTTSTRSWWVWTTHSERLPSEPEWLVRRAKRGVLSNEQAFRVKYLDKRGFQDLHYSTFVADNENEIVIAGTSVSDVKEARIAQLEEWGR